MYLQCSVSCPFPSNPFSAVVSIYARRNRNPVCGRARQHCGVSSKAHAHRISHLPALVTHALWLPGSRFLPPSMRIMMPNDGPPAVSRAELSTTLAQSSRPSLSPDKLIAQHQQKTSLFSLQSAETFHEPLTGSWFCIVFRQATWRARIIAFFCCFMCSCLDCQS